MKTAGIICEFNPFHDGHKYLIDNVRSDINPDAVVCIMSGNFVQRGRPSPYSKYERAEAAIKGGADVVLEMPVCVSVSSAKFFAKGGVDIAKALGVSYLCFGSSAGDLGPLKALAENGIESIEEGNNILACEYLRNLEGSGIIPWTVGLKEEIGHASDIRKEKDKEYEEKLFSLLQYKILSSDAEALAKAPEVAEGLENRIISVISKARSYEELVQSIKSKRYTYTRISRILMQILLGIEKSSPDYTYAKLLAANETGRKVLKETDLKVYTGVKPADLSDNANLALDVKAADIYSAIMGQNIYENSDFVLKPVII